MRIEITDFPRKEDEAFVIAKTIEFNDAFTKMDGKSLSVFARSVEGEITGGLTGKTCWNYLEISYLWVSSSHREAGIGTKLMIAAEAEASARGCPNVVLDTFSFQALGFYKRLGYEEFGRLEGYSGKHARHYLYKKLEQADEAF